MKADEYGVLLHTWYGGKTGCDMDYLLERPDVGFSGNVYDAGNRRSYSHDTLPLEYSCMGTGDYRVPGICVTQPDGTEALDLRYEKHEIFDGLYGINGLPHARGKGESLFITLKDRFSDIRVVLKYGVIAEKDVILRSVSVKNGGDLPVRINRLASLFLPFEDGSYDVIHFGGKYAYERIMSREKISDGVMAFSSVRGFSSHQENPSVIVCKDDCTEENGYCVAAAFVYSGSFKTEAEKDHMGQVKLVMGLNPEQFSWTLKAGEEFESPQVIMSCSEAGLSRLTLNMHNVINENIVNPRFYRKPRPVLINNWEATYFTFDEKKIRAIAASARDMGVEMMVLDDGWFGKRDSDLSGLGDWFVNEEKIRGGLGNLVKKVNDMGMKFGLWMEPEMVSEDSELYRAHPEWAVKIPGRDPVRSRFQLVLDYSNPKVVDYIFERISAILSSANIEYVKWDCNRSMCDFYTPTLSAERMGEMSHRYMLGLYSLLERVTSAFPDVMIEGCSGGGGRFDCGILYYCPQIWCSDNTDAHDRTFIQNGTNYIYPVSSVGAHVSAVPNHQTGRCTSLMTRAVAAMCGSFGYELDPGKLTEEEKSIISEQIREYRKYQPLIYGGDYYRLADPKKGIMSAWEFADKEGNEALVCGVIYRAEVTSVRKKLFPKGLDPEAKYTVEKRISCGGDMTPTCENDGRVYTGAAIQKGGITVPIYKGDDAGFTIVITKIGD